MDLITSYESHALNINYNKLKDSQNQSLCNSTDTTYEEIIKLRRVLHNSFKCYNITFLQELVNIQKEQKQQKIQTQCTIQSFQNIRNELDIQKLLNFSIIIKSTIPSYDIYISFIFNMKTATYIFTSKILMNYKILKCQSKSFIKILSRYFMNRNSKFRQGSFYINPNDSTINFTQNNHTTMDRITKLLNKPKRLELLIQFEIQIIKQRWNQCLCTLLFFLNKNTKTNKKIQQIKNRIDNIHSSIMKSHFDPKQTILKRGITSFKLYSQQQNHKSYFKNKIIQQNYLKNNQIISQSLLSILSLYQGRNKVNNSIYKHKSLHKQQLIKMIENLDSKQYAGKSIIYSEIQIYQQFKQIWIFQSGFSKVYLIEAQFKRQSDKQPLTNQLIKKIAHGKRYQNQIEILKQIKDSKCLFFPRYHFCQQQSYKKSIIMQYISESTIQRYIRSKSKYISIMTKTFFLYEIIIALRFLRDHSIVHIDLKPQNILMKIGRDALQQQHFLIKLIDFGQSYCSQFKYQNNRGYTIPYAPPQLIAQAKSFDQKTDVFSFGVIMYEILFQHFPIEILKHGKQIYQNQTYLNFHSMPFQKLDYYGLKDLSLLLYYICLKCIKPSPKQRPTLNWLSLILKEIILIYEDITN